MKEATRESYNGASSGVTTDLRFLPSNRARTIALVPRFGFLRRQGPPRGCPPRRESGQIWAAPKE
eukprot:6214681-Pleurochrysis_carterae.AAC.11